MLTQSKFNPGDRLYCFGIGWSVVDDELPYAFEEDGIVLVNCKTEMTGHILALPEINLSYEWYGPVQNPNKIRMKATMQMIIGVLVWISWLLAIAGTIFYSIKLFGTNENDAYWLLKLSLSIHWVTLLFYISPSVLKEPSTS